MAALPDGAKAWFINLLNALEQAGIVSIADNGWRLSDAVALPHRPPVVPAETS